MTVFLALVYGLMGVTLATNLWYLARRRRLRSSRTNSVSILVPARNESENLERLLPSLLRQRFATLDIIVVDDASEDDTWDVLGRFHDPRLRRVRSDGPPPGWLGKLHALYTAAGVARGDLLMFLDADAELPDDGALQRLVDRFHALPRGSAMSGLTRLTGGGQALVSMIPFVALVALPIPLIKWFARSRRVSALNGQCWMIERETYERLQPHVALRTAVLEDVGIGRYLKSHGVVTYMEDLRREVTVRMYRNLPEAWQGFRKNAYALFGGDPLSFVVWYALYAIVFIWAPVVSPWFLVASYAGKTATDLFGGHRMWVTALLPVSLVMALALQLDSAIAHWRGTATWKGRPVTA